MTETGIVLKNKDGFSQVRIERNSACASCGKCGMTESQKHVDFYVENACNAGVGDVVELDIPEANVVSLAFVAYVLPLVPALTLMFLSMFLFIWPVWASMLMFLGGFALGFTLVALIDKKRKHKWAQSPKMVAVVKPMANTTVAEQPQQTEQSDGGTENE